MTFQQTNALTYIINGTELSRDDLSTLLEMVGYDVIRDLSYGEFYHACYETIKGMRTEELNYALARFKSMSTQERIVLRQLIERRCSSQIPSPN